MRNIQDDVARAWLLQDSLVAFSTGGNFDGGDDTYIGKFPLRVAFRAMYRVPFLTPFAAGVTPQVDNDRP